MTQTLRLRVAGMHCEGCESRIGNVLRRLDGVRKVVADHRTGNILVTYEPGAVDNDQIAARVMAAGYEPLHEEPAG